jgi:hypothetical protein
VSEKIWIRSTFTDSPSKSLIGVHLFRAIEQLEFERESKSRKSVEIGNSGGICTFISFHI